MTTQSCISAAITIISNANLGLVSVVDGETIPNRITPDLTPALVIFEQLTPHTESWESGGRANTGGSKRDVWELECHLWAHYPDAASSAATFRALRDSIVEVFRANPRLGGLADTSNTTVFQAQGRIRLEQTPWQQGQGVVVRHALIAVEVQELIEGV